MQNPACKTLHYIRLSILTGLAVQSVLEVKSSATFKSMLTVILLRILFFWCRNNRNNQMKLLDIQMGRNKWRVVLESLG